MNEPKELQETLPADNRDATRDNRKRRESVESSPQTTIANDQSTAIVEAAATSDQPEHAPATRERQSTDLIWRPKRPERETHLGQQILNDPIYQVTRPANTRLADQVIYSENDIPMNTIMIAHSFDPPKVNAIMAAATRANPDVRFALMMPDNAFVGLDGLRFEDPLADYPDFADRIDIIPTGRRETNIFQGPMGQFPRDGVMPGRHGLITPRKADAWMEALDRSSRVPVLASVEAGDALGAATHLPIYTALIGKPGDTRIVTRRSTDEQFALFGFESIADVSGNLASELPQDHPFHALSREGARLYAAGMMMETMTKAGIPLDNIMPIGTSDFTYGQVLDTMPAEAIARLNPEIVERLEAMRDLRFPMTGAGSYHTDLVMFTGDGDTMFVNEDDAQDHPELQGTLEFFGFNVVPLPAAKGVSPEYYTHGRLFYVNMIMGLDSEGHTTVLMPTEAYDVEKLTDNDRRAMSLLAEHAPDIRVIPLGMGTAINHNGARNRRTSLANGPDEIRLGTLSGGPRCLTQVLDFILTPRRELTH